MYALCTDPAAQYLVDGGALLEGALRHHLGPLLLHVQHEGVQGLLDVGPVVLGLLHRGRHLTGGTGAKKRKEVKTVYRRETVVGMMVGLHN